MLQLEEGNCKAYGCTRDAKKSSFVLTSVGCMGFFWGCGDDILARVPGERVSGLEAVRPRMEFKSDTSRRHDIRHSQQQLQIPYITPIYYSSFHFLFHYPK